MVKAARYTSHGKARDVLRVEEVERPEPGPGDVRVRVHVSGVNPTDIRFRSGAVPSTIDGFQIPHHDSAGVIDAVGTGVDPARIGERVWVWLAATRRWGTAAQWTVLPAPHASPLPALADDDLGASAGIPGLTAHRCLFADGPVRDKNVLVAGGAGAVGHFAIELARRTGARVATTVDTEEKERLALAAGAQKVVYYTRADAADQIRSFAPQVERIVYGVPEQARLKASEDVTAAMDAGDLTTLPVHRFPLDDIAAAHEALEAGVVGKVLVDVP